VLPPLDHAIVGMAFGTDDVDAGTRLNDRDPIGLLTFGATAGRLRPGACR